VQNGKEEEGIKGFLVKDIVKEFRRGARLKCTFCKKNYATVGCAVKKCKKSYHLPCGIGKGSVQQFFGDFASYCETHRPVQKKEASTSQQCGVCLEQLGEKLSSGEVLWTPCCESWFHRDCLERMAETAGCHFFKCPLCNNREQFCKEMLQFGIYLPDKDADWETGSAYDDQLERHGSCDAAFCLCPDGNQHDEDDTVWEIILCGYCGSQGMHVKCGELRLLKPRWKCSFCKEALDHMWSKAVSVFTRVKNTRDPDHPVWTLSRNIMEKLSFKVSSNDEAKVFKNKREPNDSAVARFVITTVPAIDIPIPVEVYKDYLIKNEEHCQQTREPEIEKETEAAPKCVDTVSDETVSFDSDEDGEESVISFHIPSPEFLDDEEVARPFKKRKLFSDNCNFFDSPAEVSKDVFSITAVKKTGMGKLVITNSTEEFVTGVVEDVSVDQCRDEVGITSSTPKVFSCGKQTVMRLEEVIDDNVEMNPLIIESSGFTKVIDPGLKPPVQNQSPECLLESTPNQEDNGVVNLVRMLRGKRSDTSDTSSVVNLSKLKEVGVGKQKLVDNGRKAGRYQRDGEYCLKFRLPYSRKEEEAIVLYFMDKGGFKLRRGNRVWQEMANSNICPGRTWQSMKQRWDKFIMKRLDKFGLSIEEMEDNDARESSAAGDNDEADMTVHNSSMRGYRRNANYYTTAEDEKIIDYIIKHNKFTGLGGNALWVEMERNGILPGRSWGSLKERFRKVILKQIKIYNLSEKNVKKFLTKNDQTKFKLD